MNLLIKLAFSLYRYQFFYHLYKVIILLWVKIKYIYKKKEMELTTKILLIIFGWDTFFMLIVFLIYKVLTQRDKYNRWRSK